jgi:hypothetical protein
MIKWKEELNSRVPLLYVMVRPELDLGRIDLKCRIRIRIETNSDPKQFL